MITVEPQLKGESKLNNTMLSREPEKTIYPYCKDPVLLEQGHHTVVSVLQKVTAID